MGHSATVTIDGAFAIMAIINLVFIFDSYSDFRQDYYKEYIYFAIWGIACLAPIVNNVLELFNKINFLKLVIFVLSGMWIWGWVIICSDSWSGIRADYKPLSDLLISFQIISIFLGYSTHTVAESGDNNDNSVISVLDGYSV